MTFGHPRGLATLFFTEMWERFTYYGMRAVLVLFLVGAVSSGGFGIDDKTATAIYGLYTAGSYLASLPGGWIADRLIGARRAVLIGGLGIALGNALLAASTTPRGFYLGLVVIVLGVGLLKPNVSAMVADLYPEGGARRDAGFTVFYMGINLGATLGPVVTGEAQILIGPRAGFGVAGLFMAAGVLQYYLTQRHLGTAGQFVAGRAADPAADPGVGTGSGVRKPWLRLWIALVVSALALAACSFGWIAVNPLGLAQGSTLLITATAVLYFAYLFLAANLSAEEKRRAVVLVVLFLGSALFWSGYEQAGSSLNLFAERYTDRVLGSFVIPASWFQSLNPAFVIIFAPLVAWVWIALARRHLNPSAPAKFAIGVILMGSGFLVMAAAAEIVANGSKVLPYWLIATYLLHTLGELCLSPVGLSYVTKLSPKRLVGQMMGMWFLSLSLGNLAAGLIAGEFDANHVAAMPGQYMHIVYFAVGLGAVLLALSRPVKKLMGDVR
ncbi:MAG TPA: peptide MFS transporter [Steroidobacteraceae bacterium]|nr:peptide MFS transporter [Steroidobacteraceae bacterium]